MNFLDKINVTGHLTIIKLDHRLGSMEVLYEDSNVITGGLGRSIAQVMVTDGCDEEKCGIPENVPLKCTMSHYQISKWQVGQGASGVSPTSAVTTLVKPLTDVEYGGSLRSVSIQPQEWLFDAQDEKIEKQDFGILTQQGSVVSSLVSVWSLDEETANGTTIDEAGLFVENPSLYEPQESLTTGGNAPNISLLGGPSQFGQSTEDDITLPHSGGHVLAAYKQFTPIRKERYFTLLFRWSIAFSEESV